jgi:hypothetical protein
MKLGAAILVTGLLATSGAAHAQSPAADIYYAEVAPMQETVSRRIVPQLDRLIRQLVREGRNTTIDGVRVFDANDRFLPGKIAIGASYVVLAQPRGAPELRRALADFRTIADLTVGDPNESWGIYYYLLALYRLDRAGLLDQAVAPATLAKLRDKLVIDGFVDRDTLDLIDHPNNYYGVAFSIARLRALLGWEDRGTSDRLLARLLSNYRTYSGTYGFADEVPGAGRFDRYSILLIGEIAQRFIEIGASPPDEVKAWLRKSVDVLLPQLNMRGEGFAYGRSLGPYGETAFVEVLSAAATLGLLTPTEAQMAYGFSSRVAARYVDFWIDPETGSVNLWDDGRRTDAYRGKHRILGENLSLAHQLLYTSAEWDRLGTALPGGDAMRAWLRTLPEAKLTYFARGAYDRALVTVRDGERVWSLPLINGAKGQHQHTPYFPIPFSPRLVEGSPDATYPQLLPRITLADGSALMALAWMRDVSMTRDGDHVTVTYHADALDRIGGNMPAKDARIAVATRYDFWPGRVVRTDTYAPRGVIEIKDIALDFASYARDAHVQGTTATFDTATAQRFSVSGLDGCTARNVEGVAPYQTPEGSFATLIACTAAPGRVSKPFSIRWTLDYR